MKTLPIAILIAIPTVAAGQGASPYRGPVIDVHLHAYTPERFDELSPNPATGQMSVKTAEEHLKRTLELMKQHNVVVGIVSSTSVAVVRQKKLDVLGEVAAQYAGYSPSDPAFDPYWAIAEKHGVPVAIHTGGAPPRTPYTCCPKFRLRLGDPLLLEDMLVKYPRAKVYVMHAGGFFPQNALMLMTMYPHVYVDIGTLTWTPIAGAMLEPFLKEAQRRRLLDRVMFGTDQMRWPEAITMAIDNVNRLDFLTLKEKEGLFYGNAAKFLGLTAEEIARHHTR